MPNFIGLAERKKARHGQISPCRHPFEIGPFRRGKRMIQADSRGVPRVLLVDDNLDALDTLAEVLRISDFEVATASSPAEALALAADFKPDVAILDVGLPGMDGYQLAAALRRRADPAQRLRLITLSGYGRASDHQRAADAGLERHLVKPVDLDEMIAVLKLPPGP